MFLATELRKLLRLLEIFLSNKPIFIFIPWVRLTGFAWDDVAPVAVTDEEGVTEIVESSDKQLTVMLNLYMYDKESAGMAPIDDED